MTDFWICSEVGMKTWIRFSQINAFAIRRDTLKSWIIVCWVSGDEDFLTLGEYSSEKDAEDRIMKILSLTKAVCECQK